MELEVDTHPDIKIPVITAATSAMIADKNLLLQVIAEHREQLVAILHQHGAVLLRGFACDDAHYFSQAIELCRLGTRCTTSDYAIARTLLADGIYTSTDLPGDIPLPLHHEKPRSKNPPDYIYFCCITPAVEGGETIFADAAAIWQEMDNEIKEKIMAHGVVYRQFYHGKTPTYHLLKKLMQPNCLRNWADYFASDEQQHIEDNLNQAQLTWKWCNNNLLVTHQLPGFIHHPVSGKTVWFNSADYLNFYNNSFYGSLTNLPMYQYLKARYLIATDTLPQVCHYGNGQPFSAAEIELIRCVIKQHSWMLSWQKGDFMIVDNIMLMHGKQPHLGDRLLYSCMTKT